MIVTCEAWRPGLAPTPSASSLGLDLWQSPAALEWMGAYLHARPWLLRVRKGEDEATIVLLLRQLKAGLTLASAYPYGWIDGDRGLFARAYGEIRRALRRHRVARLEIALSGEGLHTAMADSIRPSLDAVRHVLALDALDATAIEKSFDPNIRWAARKAVRNGVSVRAASMADVDVVQALYAKTMQAKHAPVNYGRERWGGVLSQLEPLGGGHIYLAHVGPCPVGMAAVADAALSRHLLQLAVPPEHHSTRTGELLVMTAIRDALESGKRHFDFMASRADDAGLIAFKAKWGTRAEPIRHVVVPVMPLVAPLVDAGRWLNRRGARLRAQ
jgi:hypothetical protein